jgi:uncharacterized protein YjbI with pentapeptide repeats
MITEGEALEEDIPPMVVDITGHQEDQAGMKDLQEDILHMTDQELPLQDVILQDVTLQDMILQDMILQDMILQDRILQDMILRDMILRDMILQDMILQEINPLQLIIAITTT